MRVWAKEQREQHLNHPQRNIQTPLTQEHGLGSIMFAWRVAMCARFVHDVTVL
jgi:hypothetical protein